MPQPAKHNHPRYKVIRQEQSTDYHPEAGQRKVWTVHLEHEDGTKGTVELPDSQYTPQNVHTLASEQAQTVAQVAQLPEAADTEQSGQAGA